MNTVIVWALAAALFGWPWVKVSTAKSDADTLRALRHAATGTVFFIALCLMALAVNRLGIRLDHDGDYGLF